MCCMYVFYYIYCIYVCDVLDIRLVLQDKLIKKYKKDAISR